MRSALIALLATPLALIGTAGMAKAFPMFINGPGSYSGSLTQIGGFATYADNYGATTCSRIGNFINCY